MQQIMSEIQQIQDKKRKISEPWEHLALLIIEEELIKQLLESYDHR